MFMAAIPRSTISFVQQADELDQKSAAAILDRMQQLVYEKAIFAPVWQLAFINGVGPRVAESAFGLIPGFPYTAPFEDIATEVRKVDSDAQDEHCPLLRSRTE